ncbi:MAG TPA: hypothetical protein VLF93_01900 [Candidatus Saccharimonadales bacterium]|nr:hypothetical protein [Candidatus Saccharimonadales bacterium]
MISWINLIDFLFSKKDCHGGVFMKKYKILSIIVITIGIFFLSAAAVYIVKAASSLQTFNSDFQFSTAVLTPDGTDHFNSPAYTSSNGTGLVTISAPSSNTSNNYREVFWPTGAPDMSDSEVCATWNSQSIPMLYNYEQEGLALHITQGISPLTGQQATRTITVTKNVIYSINWVFNVHTWDSSTNPQQTQIGQFDMTNVVTKNGTIVQLPWRICAQTVGTNFQFKVWLPNSEPEPSWTDTTHSATIAIPAAYQNPGKTGWYVGHIPPGGNMTYNHMGVWSL